MLLHGPADQLNGNACDEQCRKASDHHRDHAVEKDHQKKDDVHPSPGASMIRNTAMLVGWSHWGRRWIRSVHRLIVGLFAHWRLSDIWIRKSANGSVNC